MSSKFYSCNVTWKSSAQEDFYVEEYVFNNKRDAKDFKSFVKHYKKHNKLLPIDCAHEKRERLLKAIQEFSSDIKENSYIPYVSKVSSK